MANVDHIISISNTVEDYIKTTYKVPDEKITVIPRGCDLSEFNQEPLHQSWKDEWYKEFPQTLNKKIIMLPARITKWKGVDVFIDWQGSNPNEIGEALKALKPYNIQLKMIS